jgi:S1-C subfamily serine protease
MRTNLMLTLCVLMVGTVPIAAEEIAGEKNASEASNPHLDLRDAVAKIRSHYAPEYNALVDYRLAGRGRHLRLGIILGGVWAPDERAQAGAVIMAVTPGSPAVEAGLKAGDVIISFNGEPLVDGPGSDPLTSVRAARKLAELSKGLEDGETVILEYLRDGSAHRVELTAREIELDPVIIGRLDKDDLADITSFTVPQTFPGAAIWHLPRGWLDMELVALNPELGEYFGADHGVLVVRAPKEDDTLGLQSGDVILRIGDREVKSPEHAMRILRSYEPEEELLLHIIRRGRSETLTATVPESPLNFDYSWDFKSGWKSDEN